MSQLSILHSIKWNYFGALFKGVSQLAVLAVMARLLNPEEFGLMALALVAIKFGSYFSDFGLAAAIQQKKEISDSDIQASFWFSTLAGFLFFLLTVLLAEPLGQFFDAPKLVPVINLVALSFVLIGASATSTGLLKRNMQFRYLSIAEIITYLIGNGLIGILLAFYGYGVFSLAIAYLSQLFLLSLAAYAKTRHSIKLSLNPSDYQHVLTFGGGYSLASFMTYLCANIDHILVGKFFPASDLGLWNRSRNIILMPIYSLHISITRVLFPAYSKHQYDRPQLAGLYIKSLIITGFFLIPIGGGMFAAAPQLVDVLLGNKWKDAVPFVQLSALFVPAEMLASFAATACTALGLLSIQIRLQVLLLIIVIPIMLFFALAQNLQLVLITLAVYFWIRFIVYLILVGKKLGINFNLHLKILVSQLFCGLWVGELIYLAGNYCTIINSFQFLPIEMMIGAVALIIYVLFGPAKDYRRIIYDFLDLRKGNNKLFIFSKNLIRKGC